MFKITCELYTFDIKPQVITITPNRINSLPTITIHANEDEDFSIFDLGPEIARDITIQAHLTQIGTESYANSCIKLTQRPGFWVSLVIKRRRTRESDPLDSGDTIYNLKDYVVKYN